MLATYLFLYPLPILMVAYGANNDDKLFGILVGLIGAAAWYGLLGIDGTVIGLVAMGTWWVLWTMVRVLFGRR